MKRTAVLSLLLSGGLIPGTAALGATSIECPAALTTQARDPDGVLWQAPGSSWLDEMSLDNLGDQPGSQMITCTFEISGAIETYVDGDCTVEAGDYAEIEESDDGGIHSVVCVPSNGRTEECQVTCK